MLPVLTSLVCNQPGLSRARNGASRGSVAECAVRGAKTPA
ncbi:hypothetical protein HMPREF0576_1398 [Mobiluncus holmesii ATCC 35242]|uniref:Uncharacterized protein n=1 Tax=Mobiluncus holmesii ATCC 35242 TaxID=887899 RepID=E6M508_9ACTO|nr:hypothetical protein HMPREF0576_1398 [Mobiluncus holmesii ATCC 35242]